MPDNQEKEELKKLVEHLREQIAQLHQIATHDEKTGVYNSMFFKSVFEFELQKVKREGTFSLIVIDIDFFKKVNDTYGHMTADKILERVAKVLHKQMRGGDVLARFGGEEFFVILPDTKLSYAAEVAERLRKKILSDVFLKKYTITISLGVATYKKKDTFDTLSNRADQALYKAKRNGRNRVETRK